MKPESLWESDSKSKIKAFKQQGLQRLELTSVTLVIFDTSWKLDRNHIPSVVIKVVPQVKLSTWGTTHFCFYLFFLQSGKRPVGFVIPTGRTLFQHFSHPQRLIYTHRILPAIAVHYSKRSKSFHRTGRLIFGLTIQIIRFKYRWIKSIVIIVNIRAISVVSIRVQINIIVTVGFQETVITSQYRTKGNSLLLVEILVSQIFR